MRRGRALIARGRGAIYAGVMSNRILPVAPPTAPPPVGTRLIGFFLLGGTMWIAGLLALVRSVMAVMP